MTDNGNNTYDMPVIAPATGDGTITVSVAEDVVTPGNNSDSVQFAYAEPTITLLHIVDGDDDNIRVIPTDTADGDDATVYRTYTIPNATDVQSLVFDGTHFHTTNWNSNTVIVFGPNTQDGQSGTVARTYTVTDISQPSGMAFDGTHIHISDRNDDNIRVIAPDTANGETATVLRTYEVPNAGDIRGMTFDGTNLHAADYTDDNIRVFAPDTADNDDATVLRTYTVPDANHIRAITFDGTHIHVSDVTDDNFRVIAVPAAGGAQTVLRTYEVPGVNLPRGFAYVAPPVTEATLTVTTTDTDIREGESVDFTITSDIDITDFTLADITVTGGTANTLTSAGTNEWTLNVTAGTGAGTIRIQIAENAVMPGNVEVDESFTRNALPTLTVTTTDSDIREGEVVDFRIVFSESVTGFAVGDITVTGATVSNLTGSGDTYDLVTTAAAGAGSIVVSIEANVVSPGNAAASETFTRNALPTPTITFNPTSLRNGRTSTATIVWSESVSGFTIADVSVSVGSLANFTGSGDTYTVDVTAPDSGTGTITLTIRENAVTLRNAEATETIAYSALPTATITFNPTQLLPAQSGVAHIVWSEAVTDFDVADVSLDVGTRGTMSGSGSTYTVGITAPGSGSGTITLTVREDAVSVGNDEITATVDYAPAAPTDANLTITTTDTDIRAGESVSFAIASDIDITDFTASDITVSGGTRGTLTETDAQNYVLSVTAGAAGTLNISINADVVSPGNSPASANFTVNALPTVVITSSDADIREGETPTITFQWSEAVTGFLTGDVVVTGATKGAFTAVDADTYTLGLTADSGAGDIVVTVIANAVTLNNALTSETFTRSALPTVAITFSVTEAEAGVAFDMTAVWSEAVTGFDTADITLSDGTKGAFTAVSATSYRQTITPPLTGSGTITVTIRANAVAVGNAETTADIDYMYVPMPPVWQTGVALVINVAAGGDLTVDVADLVSGETSVSLVSTLEAWMAWNDTTDVLTLTNARLLTETQSFKLSFQRQIPMAR